MRRTKGRDNDRERQVRSALFQRGKRFRVHARIVSGTTRTVDIAFPAKKVAVFLDGCFWHGCPEHGTMPKRNGAFWATKIARNRERDQDTDARLRGLGWRVLRYWEHENSADVVESIIEELGN